VKSCTEARFLDDDSPCVGEGGGVAEIKCRCLSNAHSSISEMEIINVLKKQRHITIR